MFANVRWSRPFRRNATGEVVGVPRPRGPAPGNGDLQRAFAVDRAWRRLSRERVLLDEAFIKLALERAIARRAPGAYRRIVWSESDDLPGVVADQYGEAVVVQIQTLAMEKRSMP